MPGAVPFGILPRFVQPGMPRRSTDQAGSVGAVLAGTGKRVGLDQQIPSLRITNLELVAPFLESRDEYLPDTLVLVFPHRMTAPIPLVEVSCDAHAACVGRPYGKQRCLRPHRYHASGRPAGAAHSDDRRRETHPYRQAAVAARSCMGPPSSNLCPASVSRMIS